MLISVFEPATSEASLLSLTHVASASTVIKDLSTLINEAGLLSVSCHSPPSVRGLKGELQKKKKPDVQKREQQNRSRYWTVSEERLLKISPEFNTLQNNSANNPSVSPRCPNAGIAMLFAARACVHARACTFVFFLLCCCQSARARGHMLVSQLASRLSHHFLSYSL